MATKKVLPKDTDKTVFFMCDDRIFSLTKLPDERQMLCIVHTWGDGEIMDFGYDHGEGLKTGLNPLHIVRIYGEFESYKDRTLFKHCRAFLKHYYREQGVMASPSGS